MEKKDLWIVYPSFTVRCLNQLFSNNELLHTADNNPSDKSETNVFFNLNNKRASQ